MEVAPPTGRRGRPRKVLNHDLVKEAFAPNRRITITAYANAVGVHRNKLSEYLREVGLKPSSSDISDDSLDQMVRDFRKQRPQSGLLYITGHIREKGIHVPRSRIRQSVKRVDPTGLLVRRQVAIKRRRYKVAGPNEVWHTDAHLKLSRYGVAIHIFNEGYARLVCIIYFISWNQVCSSCYISRSPPLLQALATMLPPSFVTLSMLSLSLVFLLGFVVIEEERT